MSGYGTSVFSGCSELNIPDLVIPNTVTSIGDYAFNGCSNITSITVPNSVTSIGNGAFRGTNPTKVTLPFIGHSKTATGNARIFGYVFGLTEQGIPSYNNFDQSLVPTGAIYANFRRYESNYYYYSCCYIPKTIKEVVITGDTSVPYQAFYSIVIECKESMRKRKGIAD